ncbi:autotransporter domain-containing protein [Sinorhizobium medicae]|nr:autotransporter domain-containing protein [Sinorhizobium medicae]MDX0866314.1 autotransporter domain-containing protein [Sinorhizobium medicae]
MGDNWALTPQAQLSCASVDFDDFTDPFAARVSLDDGDSLRAWIGMSIDYENVWQGQQGDTRRMGSMALPTSFTTCRAVCGPGCRR